MAQVVDSVWRWGPSEAALERVLPDGAMDLIVFDSAGSRQAIFAGPSRGYTLVPIEAGARLFGARLQPGIGGRIVGAPAASLVDADVPLEAIDPAAARRIGSADPEEIEALILETIEAWSRRRKGTDRDARVARAIAELRSGATIAGTADRIGVDARTLHRDFAALVGPSPKHFARIARMHRALRIAERHAPIEVALLAGYADQAHYTRELVELAGLRPSELLPMSDSFKTAIARTA
jgi:AraC-like DNA-binding protein